MKAAIVNLEIYLQTLEHNEPIHRGEGNIEQADAEAANALEVREALGFLKAASDPSMPKPPETFGDKIRYAINCHSKENGSDTPDHILAKFLLTALTNFDAAVQEREKWHGRTPALADPADKPVEDRFITFEEFVQHGIDQGVPLTNGMPWAFEFHGYPVTHETDDHYRISGLHAGAHVDFHRGEQIKASPRGIATKKP